MGARVDDGVKQRIRVLLKAGMLGREIKEKLGVSLQLIGQIRRDMGGTCGCGRLINHPGDCQCPGTLIRHHKTGSTYIGKESIKRNDKIKWMRYMNSNPFYFEGVCGVKYSEEAVQMCANASFKKVFCTHCGEMVEAIRCMNVESFTSDSYGNFAEQGDTYAIAGLG